MTISLRHLFVQTVAKKSPSQALQVFCVLGSCARDVDYYIEEGFPLLHAFVAAEELNASLMRFQWLKRRELSPY